MRDVLLNNTLPPPTSLVNKLLKDFKNNNYEEAEKLAVSMSEEFPSHEFSWKVLGLLYNNTNRSSAAISAHKKAIKINPKDAETHNNLGITFLELDLFEEALASLQKAIFLDNKFTKAYNNLGQTFLKLGKVHEAEINCQKALTFEPNCEIAYNILGNIMQTIGKLDKAEEYYSKAIELKFDYPDAHYNFGNLYLRLNKLEEAEVCYSKAITFNPRFISAIVHLSIILDYKNHLNETKFFLEKTIELDPYNFGLKAGVNLAILKFLDSEFSISEKILIKSINILEKSSDDKDYNNEKKYFDFLLTLLNWHKQKPQQNNTLTSKKVMFVIGESHALVSHRIHIERINEDFECKSFLIQGCKQFHLGNSRINKYKTKFENIFKSLPKSSKVLLCFGEIDCRFDSGIISHRDKYKENNIQDLISTTIQNFLNYILKINSYLDHNIFIQGVPCPKIDIREFSTEKVIELTDVIKRFNIELKNTSKKMGFGYLDVYKLTNRGDGLSNDIWHLDNHHLSPEGMQKAWKEYAFY